ncbi:MAG: hypothetical protein WCT28_00580 [Patescibacteria group bacterium]|jgi:hypothetical protein
MEFSEHYSPFTEKTLIVLTNTERARILSAFNRNVEEIDDIRVTVPEQNDFDALKASQLSALGKKVSKRIELALKKEGFTVVTVCVPEVNREQLIAAMDHSIVSRCASIIPKNLCAMDLPVVMRILLES